MKETVIAITISEENINVGHYVTIFQDASGHIKIRKSIAGDDDFVTKKG